MQTSKHKNFLNIEYLKALFWDFFLFIFHTNQGIKFVYRLSNPKMLVDSPISKILNRPENLNF